jgi:two-component system, response regulator YesN
MVSMSVKISKRLLFIMKYLGYFILLLIIPLILFGSLIFNVYLDVLEKEIEKSNINMVEVQRNSIDKEFSQIYSIYYQIFTDSTFSTIQIPENSIRVVETLSNYDSMNDLTRNIVVYPRGSSILYTSYGTQSFKSFLSQADVFNDWDESTFGDKLNNLLKTNIKPAVNIISEKGNVSGKYASLMLPLPPDSKNPDRTVMFLIDNIKMLSLLGSSVAEQNEDFLVLDSGKKLVCSLGGKTYDEFSEFKSFINEVQLGKIKSGVLNIDNVRYFTTSAASSVTGMYYIRLLPERQALSQLYYVRSIFLYALILVFIIGGILILLNLMNNINPLADLMYLSEKILPNTKPGLSNTPSIKDAVGEVIKTYGKLESQLSNSMPAVKEHILEKVLHGNADKVDIGFLPEKRFSLDITDKYYFTAVINILNPISLGSSSYTEVANAVEILLENEIEGYCKPAIDTKKLILILSIYNCDNKVIVDKLILIRNMLNERFQMETAIGVGLIYDLLSNIGKSFIEANSALDYMLVQGSGSIIFWESVSMHHSESSQWYPKAELERLENFILQWDSESIEKTVILILEAVKVKRTSLSVAKCISFDIINTVIRGITAINPSLKSDESINLNLFSLTEIKTLDELFDKIVSISRMINELMQQNKQVPAAQLISSILEYLNNNYYKYDFTVEAMAEHFALSPVYLRKVFKEATGSTILSYANSLRTEKAKELLKATDMNLGDIVKSIGYIDSSSFVRKFKQETGITPGEFRKINK